MEGWYFLIGCKNNLQSVKQKAEMLFAFPLSGLLTVLKEVGMSLEMIYSPVSCCEGIQETRQRQNVTFKKEFCIFGALWP